jgi:hypothetical protein
VKLDNETRARIVDTVTTDFDPASATVELSVDGTWYAATWTGPATSTGGKWTRRALTDDYFAAPAVATPAGATVLTAGRHLTQTRVTLDGDQIVAASTPIDVT